MMRKRGREAVFIIVNNEIRCRWETEKRKRGKSDDGTKPKTQNRIGRNSVDSIVC
jgi:hypothetical protein